MIADELVYIIDDDLIQNEIHTLLFQKLYPDVTLRTFTSANEALQAIDAHEKPSIIFLDLHVPGEDETFFLDEHKNRAMDSEVYLMSSMSYIQDQSLMKIYPAVKDFISKPLLEHKLKPVLNHYA